VVGWSIREEELNVGTVDSLGADDVDFLRVAGFDDPEMVLVHVLVGGVGPHLQEALLGETSVEERGDASTMSCLDVPGGPGEEVTVVLGSAENHETWMLHLLRDWVFFIHAQYTSCHEDLKAWVDSVTGLGGKDSETGAWVIDLGGAELKYRFPVKSGHLVVHPLDPRLVGHRLCRGATWFFLILKQGGSLGDVIWHGGEVFCMGECFVNVRDICRNVQRRLGFT